MPRTHQWDVTGLKTISQRGPYIALCWTLRPARAGCRTGHLRWDGAGSSAHDLWERGGKRRSAAPGNGV